MAFIKTGDSMVVTNFINDGGNITCRLCDEPITTVAINDDNSMEIVCTCEYPEAEADNAQSIS